MQDFSRIQRFRHYEFGSDPEIFSRSKDGKILPAFEFLPPKDKPLKVDVMRDGTNYGATVYNDGFQAELGAYPYGCIAYLVDSIRNGLKGIWEKSNGASLVLDNAPMIPIDILKNAPEQYVILGCDPSHNAYHMGGRDCGDPRKLRYRFNGVHIHMSGWGPHYKTPEAQMNKFVPYVKAFDSILGVFFVAAGAHLESNKRREYYGLAGEYRLPPHGLEYRVLSSPVLTHPGITNLAFEIVRGVLALVDSKAQELWQADEQEVIGIINENNQKAARALITKNKDLLDYLTTFGRFGSFNKGWKPQVYNLAMNGIESLVKDPGDFVSNWKFNKLWIGHGDGSMESWGKLSNQ